MGDVIELPPKSTLKKALKKDIMREWLMSIAKAFDAIGDFITNIADWKKATDLKIERMQKQIDRLTQEDCS